MPFESFVSAPSAIFVPGGPTSVIRFGVTLSATTSMTSTDALPLSVWWVAVAIARPGARDRTRPLPSTVATFGLSQFHATGSPGSGWPFLSTTSNLRLWVCPGP